MNVTGMTTMLTQTGLSLIGQVLFFKKKKHFEINLIFQYRKHHLGMDDVSNIARVTAWLIYRGAKPQ